MKQQLNKQANNNINRFVTSVAGNDFANANKYLKSIIENKLLKKLNNFKNKPLF